MNRTAAIAVIVVALSLFAAACSSGGSAGPTSASAPSIPPTPPAPPTTTTAATRPDTPPTPPSDSTAEPTGTPGEIVLAAGTLDVPGAQAFGDPGFHEPLEISAPIPAGAEGRQGRLVLRLADAARPGITCESEHPLSGCVTVDWSDFADRPGVPPGGVFDNHLGVVTAEGPELLFLSESGALAASPDDYSPG